MLKYKENLYRGVEVVGELPSSAETFTTVLAASLDFWRSKPYEHVWLTIPISQVTLIPIATGLGFDFHHSSDGTQVDEASLTLYCLLTVDAYVIHGPTHYVAVGAVVINAQNELLVVREVAYADQPGRYKLPGGYLDPGEHLVTAAEREVEEETGVKVRFNSLYCFRHMHKTSVFNRSGIYFICQLDPLSVETRAEEGEIAEVRWLAVDQFLAMETVQPHPKGMVRAVLGSEAGLTVQQIADYDYVPAEQIELFLPKEKLR